MRVTIDKLNHEGKGITKIDNKITFINNALPEEELEVEITKSHKKYNEGIVTKYIKKSSSRNTPTCPYYGICGGCDIMHMTYNLQTNFKKEKVKNILKRYANIDIEPILIKSDKTLGYRNKITLHYKNNHLGYMKSQSNEIIEINDCPLVMDNINLYLKDLKNIKEDLIIRENTKGKVITNINNDKMIEEINDFKFLVDTSSFFQVNHYICSCIFDLLDKEIEENSTCLDLYSGVGTLSIVASKKSRFVYSIEVNEYSHKNAKENLTLNKISNIEFMHGLVEEEIKKIHEKVDIIITDPPRKGMDEVTMSVINELSPKKIIYISCNPITLARDLKSLNNYKLTKIYALDMFPNTHHVECVCVLNR